jgi:hypothetical protein
VVEGREGDWRILRSGGRRGLGRGCGGWLGLGRGWHAFVAIASGRRLGGRACRVDRDLSRDERRLLPRLNVLEGRWDFARARVDGDVVDLEDLSGLGRHVLGGSADLRRGRAGPAVETAANGKRRVEVRLVLLRRSAPEVDAGSVHELDPRDALRRMSVHVGSRHRVLALHLQQVDESVLGARVGELAVAGRDGQDRRVVVGRFAGGVDVRSERRRALVGPVVLRDDVQSDQAGERTVKVGRDAAVLVGRRRHQAHVDVRTRDRRDVEFDGVLELAVGTGSRGGGPDLEDLGVVAAAVDEARAGGSKVLDSAVFEGFAGGGEARVAGAAVPAQLEGGGAAAAAAEVVVAVARLDERDEGGRVSALRLAARVVGSEERSRSQRRGLQFATNEITLKGRERG